VLSILAALGVLGGIFASQYYFNPEERDARMCPVSGPSGVDIVVIDKSDEWNESQKIRLRNAIVDIQSAIERDRLLEIFVFSDLVEVGFQPMFSNCSPGRGSETNEFIDNPRMRQQAFDQGFERPLAEILTQLAEPDSGSSSPILEVLSDISSRVEYRGIDGDRRIVVISDMIQNSEALSLFREEGAAVDIDTVVDSAGGDIGARFAFDVRQIPGRFSEAQLANARQFWERWAADQGLDMAWSPF